MSGIGYASSIPGFRLFEDGGDRHEYQVTSGYTYESALRLLSDLPNSCEVCFFDPEEEREEAYIFVRRAGSSYKLMRARHGSFSKWKVEPLPRIVALFEQSPLVKKPSDSFESFRVSLIPEHQQRWHIDGFLPNSRPWWRLW